MAAIRWKRHPAAYTPFSLVLFILIVCFAPITCARQVDLNYFQNTAKFPIARRVDSTKTFDIPFNITLSYGEIYGFNCSIGTPPQNVHIGINVFRSDTQVSMNITKNPWATAYNSSRSTSANPLLEFVELIYNAVPDFESPNSNLYDINYALVFYATDSFSIPSSSKTVATLKDVPLVAYSNVTFNNNITTGSRGLTDYDYNWIGLGVESGQAIVQSFGGPGDGKPYPTFAQHFMNASLIDSNTYSIWLDPVANQTGHLLMGGLDSFRYKGQLVNLPTVLNSTSDSYGLKFQPVLTCSVDSITINKVKVPNTKIDHVALAHSPVTLLSAVAARAVWDAVGATYNPAFNLDQITPTVPCSYLTNTSTFDIQFSAANLTLSVPISYITARGGQGPLRDSGASADTCILLVQAVGRGLPSMLGTGIMRNLYTVYDLSNQILSVALTDFENSNDGLENVLTIPTGGVAAIKQDLFKSRPAKPSSTAGSSNGTVSNTSAPDQRPKKGPNSVAIGVGVAVPVVAILALGLGFVLFRRRRRAREQGSDVKTKGSVDEHSGTAELENEQKGPGRSELADEQKPKGELMGNPVSELDNKSKFPTTENRHELG